MLLRRAAALRAARVHRQVPEDPPDALRGGRVPVLAAGLAGAAGYVPEGGGPEPGVRGGVSVRLPGAAARGGAGIRAGRPAGRVDVLFVGDGVGGAAAQLAADGPEEPQPPDLSGGRGRHGGDASALGGQSHQHPVLWHWTPFDVERLHLSREGGQGRLTNFVFTFGFIGCAMWGGPERACTGLINNRAVWRGFFIVHRGMLPRL